MARRRLAGITTVVLASFLGACGSHPADPVETSPAPATAPDVLWTSPAYRDGSGASEAFAVDGGTIVATPVETVRLDAHGSPVWSVAQPARLRHRTESAVVADRVLVISHHGGWRPHDTVVRALDAQDGSLAWTRARLSRVAVGRDEVFATACRAGSACRPITLDPETGKLLCRGSVHPCPRSPGSPHPTPSAVIASSGGVEVTYADGELVARDAGGARVWRTPAPGEVHRLGADSIVVGTTGRDGREKTVVRSIATGRIKLRLDGRYVSAGPSWIAVFRRTDGSSDSGRLLLLSRPT
ncbi:outer membrane protein assembly factor BamB family protein [Nocardioides montaniterrae]